MPKTQTRYVCQNCGRQSPRYMGRCPSCGEYNTMVEEVTEVAKPAKQDRRPTSAVRAAPQRLTEVSNDVGERLFVPVEECNRLLGGRIVPRSIILIDGEPGIGKSTIMLSVCNLLAEQVGIVLYVSGEESARQIKMRADRLGLASPDLYLLTETNLGNIFEHVNQLSPTILIVDSIQTTYTEESESSPGSVSQVRECARSE